MAGEGANKKLVFQTSIMSPETRPDSMFDPRQPRPTVMYFQLQRGEELKAITERLAALEDRLRVVEKC